jgi:uncharacterized membrane protein (UPF0127 family)
LPNVQWNPGCFFGETHIQYAPLSKVERVDPPFDRMGMKATNSRDGKVVASCVTKADTTASRVKGLLGREKMSPSEALWIIPCSNIHTFFMRFPIDVLFLDERLKVLRVIENLKPWRISPWVWKAQSVLEMGGGSLGGRVGSGDVLEIG